MNHFGEEEIIPHGRTHFCYYFRKTFFREQVITSVRKISRLRERYLFYEEEIISARKKLFLHDRDYAYNQWLYFKRPAFNQLSIQPSYEDKFFMQENFYLAELNPSLRKSFFLVEIFLPGGDISSLQTVSSSGKWFLSRENDFFLAETISSLWKWTLSGGSDSYLVEIISSSPKWYLPRGNNMFLVEITCSLRKWFPRVNAFWHRHVRLGLPYNHGLTCTYATKLRISNNN